MKKIIFIFLIASTFAIMGCQLEPVGKKPNSETTDSGTKVYVAYNINNVWYEELLTASFDEGMVWYWNYISEGLRYWDRECTDPILGNDRNAVNSHSGRLYWSSTLNRFVPYNER